MGNLAGFNAANVDIENKFDAVPAGDYVVIVTDSNYGPTNDGNGERLSLDLEIQEPEQFRGKKLWDNLNMVNANQTAVEIAIRQLGQLCMAANVPEPDDSQQLHFIPVIATVAIDKRDKTRNQVKAYKKLEGSAAGAGQVTPFQRPTAARQEPAPAQQTQPAAQQAPAQAAQQTAPAQAAAANTPPWMRK